MAGVGGEFLVSGGRVGLVDHTLVGSQARHAVTPVLRGKQWRPGTKSFGNHRLLMGEMGNSS